MPWDQLAYPGGYPVSGGLGVPKEAPAFDILATDMAEKALQLMYRLTIYIYINMIVIILIMTDLLLILEGKNFNYNWEAHLLPLRGATRA